MKLTIFTPAAVSCLRLATAFRYEQIILGSGPEIEVKPMSVAIIGAGAAGASSAYHLARFAQSADMPINITVYERNSYIGGRSTTVNAYGNDSYPIELGASIFVQVNQILVDAVNEFNLSTGSFGATSSGAGPALGVWNGKELVLTMNSEDSTWWSTAKLLWKYGLAPIRTMNLMKATLAKFFKMYDEPIFPFASLTQAAQDVGLLAVSASTGEQYLRENNIGLPFARDVIQASTRVNYAQNLNFIHGLETMVCMATDGAMSVEGGNWQIFDNMIAAANATRMLGTAVTAIERHNNGTYTIVSAGAKDEFDTSSHIAAYDSVILAAPYQFANFTLPGNAREPDEIPYVKLHVTLFASPHLLSPAFFNQPAGKQAPLAVLTTLQPDEHPHSGPEGVGSPGFFSVSTLAAVINPETGKQEFLYKIFSPSPVNGTLLSHLLGQNKGHDVASSAGELSKKDVSWIYRKVWNSYPYELPRVTFEDISLGENIWYTSGIESFISTMETSALMGKNVARLIVDQWQVSFQNGQ